MTIFRKCGFYSTKWGTLYKKNNNSSLKSKKKTLEVPIWKQKWLKHEMEACASVVWRIFALGEIMNCLCCCCYFDQLNLCWANFHFQHGFTINSHRHIYWLTDTRTHINALWANLKHSKPHSECYACAAFDCSFVRSFVYCWIHQFLL